MRPARWLVPALVAGVLAGCGGDDESGSPADSAKPPLTVPGATTDSTDATESTPTAPDPSETAPPADAGTPTGPMDQPNPGNGGVPAPDSNNPPADQPPDSPANDTPPEPGSPQERFEQFCEKNPGAC